MVDILLNYGLFLIKTITIVAACLFLFGGIVSLLFKGKSPKKDHVRIVNLNQKYNDFAQTLKREILSKHSLKQDLKKKKGKQKTEKKKQKQSTESRRRLFVLTFDGDIRASAVDALKEEISAVLTVAEPTDEILVCIESGGGMVHSYGLAASQLMRIKKRDIPLTVSVDKIAASGGYLMACVADHIIAAPFAIIGSIGVIAQLPNFNRLLKKHDIDYEQITAGQFKRTLTMFGENTDNDREKLKEELEHTHELFKEFVLQGRKELDIDKIATGEHWYGSKAIELKLVDELITSDDYILSKCESVDVYEVTYKIKKSITEKLPLGIRNAIYRLVNRQTSLN